MKIVRPTLLVDRKRVTENIERMAGKVSRSGVCFRPHFKTHQSAEIGEWFRGFGVQAITVSSVQMAAYFSQNGWRDITIAFPVNRLEIAEINELCREIALGLLVESQDTAAFLQGELIHQAKLWIKIDTGYKRAGISCDNTAAIVNLAKEIERSPKMMFKGILTHSGHAYQAKSKDEIKAVYADTVSKMNLVREKLHSAGFRGVEISIGDTPGCSLADDFSGVDEVRCGNFVFYDVMQLFLGSCKEEDIALALACPVVARYPERDELVIYGGAVHLSSESIVDAAGRKLYGLVALPGDSSWGRAIEDTYVRSLSQEHGIISTTPSFLERVNVGDILMILPVHSCLTANLMRRYRTLTGRTVTTLQ